MSTFAAAIEKIADYRSALLEMWRNRRLLATREFDRQLLADRFADVREAVTAA